LEIKNLPEHQKGLAAVFVAALIWSTGGMFIKLVPLEAIQICFFRSALAALVFMVLFKKAAFNFDKFVLINAICYAGLLITFVIATKLTTAANAIFLQYTAPIYVFFLEPLLFKTKFEKINIVTVVLCFTGMLLFFVGELSPGHMLGNAIALLGGVFLAAMTLGMKKNKPENQYASVFYGNIIICIVALPFMFSIGTLTAPTALRLAYLGIIQIGIAYALFSYGIKRTLAIEASLIAMVEPVFNPIWVLIGYGEKPSFFSIVGGCIILFGVITRTVWSNRIKAA